MRLFLFRFLAMDVQFCYVTKFHVKSSVNCLPVYIFFGMIDDYICHALFELTYVCHTWLQTLFSVYFISGVNITYFNLLGWFLVS